MARLVVNIGKVLQQKMEEYDITVSDLSKTLNMTEKDINRILTGDVFVSPKIYENLCTMLRTSFEEVVGAAVKTP